MQDVLTNLTIQRAAVCEWRDVATTAAIKLMHYAAVKAMAALDAQLEKTALADAAINYAALAHQTVESAMRERIDDAVTAWVDHHANALRAIDPRLTPVAHRFAEVGDPAPLLQKKVSKAPASWCSTPTWVSASLDTVGTAIGQMATTVADRAIPEIVRDKAGQWIDQAGREIGERSGIRDRVRSAGRDELARAWLGTVTIDGSELPRAYLTQLLERIDRAFVAAKAALA